MKLNKKHYMAIAFVLLVIIAVLLSQFPLKENTEGYITNEKFYEDIEDNPPLNDFVNKPTPHKIALNFESTTTGCMGKIEDNVFIPDKGTPRFEETKKKPVVSAGKGIITAQFYGVLFCNASKIDLNAFINIDGKIFFEEMETVDTDKFIFGPASGPPEERLVCTCTYKTTMTVTDLKPGNYMVIVERKDDLGNYYEVNVK